MPQSLEDFSLSLRLSALEDHVWMGLRYHYHAQLTRRCTLSEKYYWDCAIVVYTVSFNTCCNAQSKVVYFLLFEWHLFHCTCFVQNKWMPGRPDTHEIGRQPHFIPEVVRGRPCIRIHVCFSSSPQLADLRKMTDNLKLLHGCPLDTFLNCLISNTGLYWSNSKPVKISICIMLPSLCIVAY